MGSFPPIITNNFHSPSLLEPRKIWQTHDTFIFDVDGVLWTGSTVIDGAPKVIESLINAGKTVIILTNNSGRSTDEFLQKFERLGFRGLTRSSIVSAGVVLAHELVKMKRMPKYAATADLPVYLIGGAGLQNVLKEYGIECFGMGPDSVENYAEDTFFQQMDLSQKPFAVVCSFDPYFSYPKMLRAVNYLTNSHTPFLVTHEDMTFPSTIPDMIIPGSGAMSKILSTLSGRTPTVMGKPHRAIWEYICDHFNGYVNPKTTLMIGDQCDTDIKFGNVNGLDTLLVQSGVNSLDDVAKFQSEGKSELIPKYFAGSVKDLLLE